MSAGQGDRRIKKLTDCARHTPIRLLDITKNRIARVVTKSNNTLALDVCQPVARLCCNQCAIKNDLQCQGKNLWQTRHNCEKLCCKEKSGRVNERRDLEITVASEAATFASHQMLLIYHQQKRNARRVTLDCGMWSDPPLECLSQPHIVFFPCE
jgi:hypothetical protein